MRWSGLLGFEGGGGGLRSVARSPDNRDVAALGWRWRCRSRGGRTDFDGLHIVDVIRSPLTTAVSVLVDSFDTQLK